MTAADATQEQAPVERNGNEDLQRGGPESVPEVVDVFRQEVPHFAWSLHHGRSLYEFVLSVPRLPGRSRVAGFVSGFRASLLREGACIVYDRVRYRLARKVNTLTLRAVRAACLPPCLPPCLDWFTGHGVGVGAVRGLPAPPGGNQWQDSFPGESGHGGGVTLHLFDLVSSTALQGFRETDFKYMSSGADTNCVQTPLPTTPPEIPA